MNLIVFTVTIVLIQVKSRFLKMSINIIQFNSN